MSWISVTERLPENYKEMLVAVKHARDDIICHYGVYYRTGGGLWMNDEIGKVECPYLVTHWQPIEKEEE